MVLRCVVAEVREKKIVGLVGDSLLVHDFFHSNESVYFAAAAAAFDGDTADDAAADGDDFDDVNDDAFAAVA